MILHTTEVTPLPEYRLAVRFNNGVAGEVNLADELSGEVFESLRDPALFATAYQHPAAPDRLMHDAARCAASP